MATWILSNCVIDDSECLCYLLQRYPGVLTQIATRCLQQLASSSHLLYAQQGLITEALILFEEVLKPPYRALLTPNLISIADQLLTNCEIQPNREIRAQACEIKLKLKQEY